MITCEILSFAPEARRTKMQLDAMHAAAPRDRVRVSRTATYKGGADWLMLWGAGSPARRAIVDQQLAAGGRVIAWDLSYWDRANAYRLSIDAPHPHASIARRVRGPERWAAAGLPITAAWNPAGPIVIAGAGTKSKEQYGGEFLFEWESEQLALCRRRWPTQVVIYRPKPFAKSTPMAPLEEVLPGCALLVTYHSNAGIDAIRMGIPVVSPDGAAAAVALRAIPFNHDPRPLEDAHARAFLEQLAWFQWTPPEAPATWAFLLEELACV